MSKRTELARILDDLHSPDDATHRKAFDDLLTLGPDSVPMLINRLPEMEGRARLSMVKALGELGDPRAVGTLLELMQGRDRAEYVFVASLAAKSLSQIASGGDAGGEQAIAALIEAMTDSAYGARRMGALVLGNIRNPVAVPALTAALADDDREVRALAARALGNIGADGDAANRAVAALIVRLRDNDRLSREMSMNGQIAVTVSEVAAWALEQIDSPEAQAALEEWRDD